ncbi:hypothetical protein [Vibrio gallicus]|uniref:hypothetical protein n=1 Tax=Vibrio gallicus TaxID=190897 RepID=UPI0021C49CCF|nr:hypothetical protein [Vibrio gallicus]
MSGFSLIELLTTLCVLSLSCAVGIQSYAEYHQQQRHKLAAQQVYSTILATSNLAYAKHRSLWLHIQSATDTQHTLLISASNSPLPALTQITLEDVTLTATDASIRFDGAKGIAMGNGSIVIGGSSDSQLKVIYHQISGRIRICSTGSESLGYAAC